MIISNEHNEGYKNLHRIIEELNPSSMTILCDSNTKKYCLNNFLDALQIDSRINIIVIAAGEQNKTIDSLLYIWDNLLNYSVDRKGLLINLGGGVITDIGGFAASTFKRGIKFINVPTTLLAMVDASIGGKNGLDYGGLKNIIGNIYLPYCTLIDTSYLDSLYNFQVLNGYAEMVKHALITSPDTWNIIKRTEMKDFLSYNSILQSIEIKLSIVNNDLFENGRRKILNFGHTFGHSIEALFNKQNNYLGHGIAVSVGMKVATMISHNLGLISTFTKNDILNGLNRLFLNITIDKDDYPDLLSYMKDDKKNFSGVYRFVLLSAIGQPEFDISVNNEQIIEALNQYREYY